MCSASKWVTRKAATNLVFSAYVMFLSAKDFEAVFHSAVEDWA